MTAIKLDSAASAFLAKVQHQTGPIESALEEAISQAADKAGRALTQKELQGVMQQALPSCAREREIEQMLQGPEQQGECHGCETFPTRIFELKIKKEQALPDRSDVAPVRTDPLYAAFNMSPQADFMLLFNARDVDRNGRPLLMKVVVREGADVGKLDLSSYRTAPEWKKDIVQVAKDADVVRIQETDEVEFAFGDPLKQVSLDSRCRQINTSVMICRDNERVSNYYRTRLNPNGQEYELNRNLLVKSDRQVGEVLDEQPVVSFNDRIQLELVAPEGQLGWLDASASQYGVNLHVERGLIFEPNARAQVEFLDKSVVTQVAADDAELLGSPAAKLTGLKPGSLSLETLLKQNVRLGTLTTASDGTGKRDGRTQHLRVVDLIYPNPGAIQIGGKALAPLTSTLAERGKLGEVMISAEKRPLAGDAECDGQKIDLTLQAGFVKAAEGQSVNGWRISVGYTDESGTWKQVDERGVKGDASRDEKLSIDLANAPLAHQQRRSLEVRVYNSRGVPAQRVVVPFENIDWAPGLRQSPRQG